MAHDERVLTAFLAGDLDPTAAAAFDRHLLGCDACWTAVHEDRRARDALDFLREPAPARLADAVRHAVEAVPARRRAQRRLARTAAIGMAAALVVFGGLFAAGGLRSPPGDPPAIAAVLAAARHRSTPVAPPDLVMEHLVVNGHAVVLARSAKAFPMPAGGHALDSTEHAPWIATRGDLHLLCFSRPAPALLAGAVSATELTSIARALGLQSN